MNFVKKTAGYVLSGVFWLILWLVLASIVAKKVILPPPVLVFERLFALAKTKEFWETVGASFFRVVSGVIIAIILAILSAIGASKFKIIHVLLYPFNEVVKATPIVSFIFLAYIIFQKKIDLLPVFIVFLMVFPVVYSSILSAITNVDRELIEVASVFGCTWFEKIRYIWIPTVLNAFITSASTSLGLGWKAGIAAEALAASPNMVSIGTELSEAKTFIETVDQFAWTVAIIIISMVIGLAFTAVMNKVRNKIL